MEDSPEINNNLNDKENDSESLINAVKKKPVILTYGFLSKVRYEHKSKNCKIQSVTYNSKTCEYIIVDSRGISAWNKNFASAKTSRLMQFPAYKFNVIKILLYCRPFNLYFALTKEYMLKIYNLNFHETFSIESDTNALIHMIFNAATNELITASRSEIHIWNFGQINKQNDTSAARYGLVLKLKWEIDHGRLINRISLDEEGQRLYCLSEFDVWCYDLTGKLLFLVKKACTTHLSACTYGSNTVVAGSIDGQVSMLTTSGGKIHTFSSHSNFITEILIHPSDAHLIITASLDGYIKLFSMDLFEELYSLKVFNDGIEYMSLKSSSLLYCVSTWEIEEFDLNYLCQFWGQLRYPAQSIDLVPSADKSSRVMIVDDDNTIKLFSASTGKKLCTVLPPPTVDLSNKILSCAHDRDYSLVYVLVTTSEIWVYTTKTDPACFLASIYILEDAQDGRVSRELISTRPEPAFSSYSSRRSCSCIEILPDFFEVEFVDGDGVLQTKCNLLGCGMDSGEIMLFNPMMKGRKEKSLQICKDPIVQLKYCKELLCCFVTTKAQFGLVIKVINSTLEVLISMSCDDDVTCFSIKGTTFAAGFDSGHLIIQEKLKQQQKSFHLYKQSLIDHYSGVQSVSYHPSLNILCSAGKDYCIKLWSFDKHLLCEITLDNSLTSACFLNSSGDILMGFKGHIFVMRNSGKYKWMENEMHENERPESHVYESPHIKYELKRPPSPESDTMDNYLVPYNDMMFMTIGTWVVQNDDTSSGTVDYHDVSVSNLDSDEESMAPSDIYQSSLFSMSSIGTKQWDLPDCGFTPEGSVMDEPIGEDGGSMDEDENEKEDQMPKKESVNDDPKARLNELLAAAGKNERKKSIKEPVFVHGASKKLKNAKIDAKQLKVNKNVTGKKGQNVGTEKASTTLVSEENKVKEQLQYHEKRKIVKKGRKAVDERKRVSSRSLVKKEVLDDESRGDDGVTLPVEVTISSPDGGYDSRLSNVETPEPKQRGVLLTKKPIRLTKSAVRDEEVAEVEKEQSIDEEFNDDARQTPEEVEQSGIEHDDTYIDTENEEDGSLDEFLAVDDDLLTDRPRISSAQFGSISSRASSRRSEYSDFKPMPMIETGMAENEKIFVDIIARPRTKTAETVITTDSTRDTYKYSESMPSSRLTSTQQKTRAPTRLQGVTKMKVVPTYEQRDVKQGKKTRGKAVKHSHAPMVALALKTEKMKLRETREDHELYKQKQMELKVRPKKKEKNQEKRPKLQRSSSQAIRVTFGEKLDNPKMLSSSSIALNKSKIIINDRVLENEEKKPDDLVKFCVSALKKKTRPKEEKEILTRIHSADLAEIKRKKELFTTNVNGDENELRPRTAPMLDNERTGGEVGEFGEGYIVDTVRKVNAWKTTENSHNLEYGDTDVIKSEINGDDRYGVSEGEEFKISVRIDRKRILDEACGYREERIKEINEHRNRMEKLVEDNVLIKNADAQKDQQGYDQNLNRNRALPIDIYKISKSSLLNKSSGVYQNHLKKTPTDLVRRFDNRIDLTPKHGETFIENELDQSYISRTNTIMSFGKHSCDLGSKRVDINLASDETARQVTKHLETLELTRQNMEESLPQENSFTKNKGKILLVDIPSEHEDQDRTHVDFADVERFYSRNRRAQDFPKSLVQEKVTRVLSPQEKLLERRAISANMKRRQENAKFRRKVIDQQRRARAQSRSVSPSYSQDYLVDFLPEPEQELMSPSIYEYNKPTPLFNDEKATKNDTKQERKLRARLSGQAFRYGNVVGKDDNESIIVEFIRTSINKKSDEVVLLPRPKSMPSIPAKCHDYMLVTETKREEAKLSKLEKEILESRFSELSLPVS